MSGGTITERMQAAIPGHKERTDLQGYLQPYRLGSGSPITSNADAAHEEVLSKLRALILAGEDVPDDVAAPILEARRLDELATLRKQLLGNLARQVSAERSSVLSEKQGHAIEFLRNELDQLVKEVKKLAPNLRHIRSATEAIDSGDAAVAAWKRMSELVADYHEIRTAQFSLTAGGGSGVLRETFLNVAILGDAIDHLQYWIGRRRTSFSTRPESRSSDSQASVPRTVTEAREWLVAGLPTDPIDYTTTWWDGEDRVQHLIRVATETTPWIPTTDELMEAQQLAGTATGYVSEGTYANQQVARRAYYQLTGGKAKVKLPEPPQVVRSGTFPSKAQQRAMDLKIASAARRNP